MSVWLSCTTKYHSLGGLNNRHLFSQDFGDWEDWDWVSAGLVPPEASLLGVSWSPSPCVLTWSSLCVWLCPNLLFLEGHQSYWFRAPPWWPHFNSITSLKTLSPNTMTFGGAGGRTSAHEFWEHRVICFLFIPPHHGDLPWIYLPSLLTTKRCLSWKQSNHLKWNHFSPSRQIEPFYLVVWICVKSVSRVGWRTTLIVFLCPLPVRPEVSENRYVAFPLWRLC